MDRRKFLGWISIGFLASSLPVVIAACNKSSNNSETITSDESLPEPPITSENNGGEAYTSIGLVTQLDQEGQIVNKDKEVIVIKNPENNNLVALSSKCTHKGCMVNWKKENNSFLCPCHDAEFSVSGEVLKGPATKALTVYSVKEENGEILVSK